jgi:1,4-dihydroxy-2-naphthoyl-CoA hydrolase
VSTGEEIGLPPERTMIGNLGIETEATDDGIVRGHMPVSDRILQPYGLVHGGAMLTLAETLASHGTWVAVKDEGSLALGQEINASLLRPISSGHVNGLATARRRGRTAWIWEVEITDDAGRLCALARVTIAVRPGPKDLPETGS